MFCTWMGMLGLSWATGTVGMNSSWVRISWLQLSYQGVACFLAVGAAGVLVLFAFSQVSVVRIINDAGSLCI